MPDPKREAIFGALRRLQFEIDANRTPFESVADIAIQLADLAGRYREALKPTQSIWEKALRLIESIRKEGKTLSSPEPQGQIEDHASSGIEEVDDEVPF
ncbi:hypothetical protein H9Q09_12290 [Aurantimonas sp. DM33-3]|uniref:hypothetical protein n=1 Tax=Aurantimonas sp. DM33-3 TaxID=2766955 RepID=UPI0016525274|nr:hypothetical protein [Aurantimonas sp. DM33-3]MBC6716987.1 hypothetical protein [Aurantimonas sp. DM33-3]